MTHTSTGLFPTNPPLIETLLVLNGSLKNRLFFLVLWRMFILFLLSFCSRQAWADVGCSQQLSPIARE